MLHFSDIHASDLSLFVDKILEFSEQAVCIDQVNPIVLQAEEVGGVAALLRLFLLRELNALRDKAIFSRFERSDDLVGGKAMGRLDFTTYDGIGEEFGVVLTDGCLGLLENCLMWKTASLKNRGVERVVRMEREACGVERGLFECGADPRVAGVGRRRFCILTHFNSY